MRTAPSLSRPLRRALVAWVLVSAGIAAGAAPVSAQTTALFIDNHAGGLFQVALQELVTAGDGTFTLPWNGTATNTVWVRVSTNSWNLQFAAPGDVRLEPGLYLGATREPFTTFSAMSVSGHGLACNRLSGRFLVREIEYTGDTVERLAIDFEQHCGDGGPGLFGALRYNSTIASLTPFDGAYPEYRLEIAAPQHGRVVGGTIDCGPEGGACVEMLEAPATVTVTALPDAGYLFAGWGGTCHGSLTMTMFVNSIDRCEPRFVPIVAGAPRRMAMINSGRGAVVGASQREIFDGENARWSVQPIAFTGITRGVEVQIRAPGESGEIAWKLSVEGPGNQNITPGTYTVSGLGPGQVRVTLDSLGCSAPYGTFTLHELVIVANVVVRTAFDLDAHCSGLSVPPQQLQASVRYDSDVPIAPSLAVVTPGARGRIDVTEGVACSVNCMQPFAPGTVVSMTPVADPGFRFVRWEGDADCEDGTVTMAGPLSCEAIIDRNVSVGAVTPSSGTGITQVFTLEYGSTAGAGDIATAWLWFTPQAGSLQSESCRLYFEPASLRVFLLNEAATTWTSAQVGSSDVLQNSGCVVDAAASSITADGETLHVRAAIRFLPKSAGTKRIQLQAVSVGGTSTGWQDRGSWTIPLSRVGPDAVSPSSGSGVRQTFTLTYSNTFGADQIKTAWVWFTPGTSESAANTCLLYLDRATGTIHLLNDAGQLWTPAALGSAAVLENSRCALAAGGSSVTVTGTTLELRVAMTFTSAFAGDQLIYMYADTSTEASGWWHRGFWEVPFVELTSATASPSSGSGSAGTFTLTYGSATAAPLGTVWAWFTGTFGASAAHSCLVHYVPATGTLLLLNDAGDTWMPGTPGTAGYLQNRQCAINLGGVTVTGAGHAVTLTLPVIFRPSFGGQKQIFAYAADTAGRTSGWRDRGDWTVTAGPSSGLSADAVMPQQGTGTRQTFGLTYSGGPGAVDVTAAWVWFNSTFATSAADSCLLYYEPATGMLHLLNDAGTTWQAAPPGGPGELANAQCAVSLAASTVSFEADSLILSLAMQFTHRFAGPKQIFMYAAGFDGQASGWHAGGAWTVPAAVAPVGITPDSGSGSAAHFAATYSSVNGAAALTTTWIWFHHTPSSSSASSCLVYYDNRTNTLHLVDDTATVWLSAPLGGPTPLQNSQCTVDPAASRVTRSGDTLVLELDVTFLPGFTGPKNVYLYAADGSTGSGWQDFGDWTP